MTDEFYEELKSCYHRRGLSEPTREEIERDEKLPAWWPAFKKTLGQLASTGINLSNKKFVPGPGFKVPTE